jgi:hypothetical protein
MRLKMPMANVVSDSPKEIVKVAGKCMEKNFTMLGPLVLPLTEQLMVVASVGGTVPLQVRRSDASSE